MRSLVLIATLLLVSQSYAYGYANQKGLVKPSIVAGFQSPSALASSVVQTELKPPAAMYEGAATAGAGKAALPALKIFIMAILSGCHIAFGAYLVLSVGGACPGIAKENPGLQKIIMGAFGLPFGLMMTVIGGGELFTGNTALISAALIEKKATKKDLLKNWITSYSGNFVGSLLLAFLVHQSGTLGVGPAAAATAVAKTSLNFTQAFIRGILCNWLVCMAVYMASGASSLPGKMTAIWFPISAFIALGLEHSVANMFLIPIGMLRGAPVTMYDFLIKNLLPVTLGNMVGGICAVAGGYAATFGSLLKPKEATDSKLNSIRGGFTSGTPVRRNRDLTLAATTEKKTGTAFLSEETIARAEVGNPIEKTKLKRDPTESWTDIYEFAAAIREGKTKWEEIATDDIDVRVKYAGMFHRRKRTPGQFMMRLRIPNGVVTSDQMRYFASSVRPYGADAGVIDITTRANIQLRGMPLEDAVDIFSGLQERGLTSIMSGLDNVRNMVGSPIAGIDPMEIYDTRALCKEIDGYYSGNGKGNPEWCNMPRKFNIAISGSRDDFAHTKINDIGLQACPHSTTGEMGFNVVLGGYFSIKRAAKAIPSNIWIPEKNVWIFCKAILTLFRNNGHRKDRQKARLMWLIEEWGLSEFTERVRKEMGVLDPSYAATAFESEQAFGDEWTLGHRNLLGVHNQKQEGLSWVGVHCPVGRLSADECDSIAALADKYSLGEIRFTVEQNIILPNVPKDMVDALLAESALNTDRLSTNPGNIVGGVVSCTGAQFCGLAMVETKSRIDEITRKLDKLLTTPKAVRIHMTGCPNSCGQVQVADIGLMGSVARKVDPKTGKKVAVAGVDVFVGGSIGSHMDLSTEALHKNVIFDDETIIPLLVEILKERHGAVMK